MSNCLAAIEVFTDMLRMLIEKGPCKNIDLFLLHSFLQDNKKLPFLSNKRQESLVYFEKCLNSANTCVRWKTMGLTLTLRSQFN